MPRHALQGFSLCMNALAKLPRFVSWQGAVGRLMLSEPRRHPLNTLACIEDIDAQITQE